MDTAYEGNNGGAAPFIPSSPNSIPPGPRANSPASAQGASSRPDAWNWPSAPGKRRQQNVAEIRVGGIGRGYAGKTALYRSLCLGPVGDYLPSGLHLDFGDPKQIARVIREAEETQHLLEDLGLPPTLESSESRYFLFDGEEARASLSIREVVGQVLTHTLPESDEELQSRYDQYITDLSSTHVLWVVVPAPQPSSTPRDRRRFANDLRITAGYLQEALRHRPADKPCAVAVIISKVDALYSSPDEAQQQLEGEAVQDLLGPIVNAVNTSKKVSDAAIFPVSAFGFGNAMLRDELTQASGETPANASPQLYGAEPAWVLKPDAVQEPFNLTGLVTWTMIYGLLNQEIPLATDKEPELARVCRTLREDLSQIDSWIVPIKSSKDLRRNESEA